MLKYRVNNGTMKAPKSYKGQDSRIMEKDKNEMGKV